MIALTGTPGTGKTNVAKILKDKFTVIDLNKIIKKEKLYSGYDRKRKTYIADLKKIEKFLRKINKENLIIDSHLSHLLPKNLIDIVIVLRCEPEELKKRLKRKRWNKNKTQENYEAELIGLISFEAKKHKKVLEIDTTNKKPEKVAKIIERLL